MRKFAIGIGFATVVGLGLGAGSYTIAQDATSTPVSEPLCASPVASPVGSPDALAGVMDGSPEAGGADATAIVIPGENCLPLQ
jgi:hypothetical protein